MTYRSKRTALRLCALMLGLLSLTVTIPIAQPHARAQTEEGVIILLNARNPTNNLALAEAKKLFTGQTAFWHGVVPVKVFSRPANSAPAKAFFAMLGVTSQSFQKQWDELQLAGRGVAPKSLGSIQEAAQAVAQSPGGITFALTSEAWNLQIKGVKTIPVR